MRTGPLIRSTAIVARSTASRSRIALRNLCTGSATPRIGIAIVLPHVGYRLPLERPCAAWAVVTGLAQSEGTNDHAARYDRDHSTNVRIWRRYEQRQLAAPRRSVDGDEVVTRRDSRSYVRDRLAEIFQRNIDETAGKAWQAEISQRECRIAMRGQQRRGKAHRQPAIRAAQNDDRGMRAIAGWEVPGAA